MQAMLLRLGAAVSSATQTRAYTMIGKYVKLADSGDGLEGTGGASALLTHPSNKLKIYIIASNHESTVAVDRIRSVIQTIKPKTVAVELDETRYTALSQIYQQKKLGTYAPKGNYFTDVLQFGFASASLQEQMRSGQGFVGEDLLVTAEEGGNRGAGILFIDKQYVEISEQMRKQLSWWQQLRSSRIFNNLLGEVFKKYSEQDLLADLQLFRPMLQELKTKAPVYYNLLYDDREDLMIQKLARLDRKVVAVVGMSHVVNLIDKWDHLFQQQS